MDLPAPRSAQPPAVDVEPRGFASPARDYFDGGIDLNRHLIRDRTCTFIMRVAGSSMEGAGISDGDEIIVDRSVPPRDGSVVVAVLDGDLVVRRLRISDGGATLESESGDGAPAPEILVPDLSELVIWGVATRCLHRL
ncbi:LexA family protein [Arthrobacter sp. 35W]|uniref:LexA family protein n=1 Tax=Arthrobacter sp. 35W TaxID=1132441 RepID=UPI0006886311|nr:translesion error-prone DNA polymerase V autoproteolytic subunit [Arthrobacter sp. 35W]